MKIEHPYYFICEMNYIILYRILYNILPITCGLLTDLSTEDSTNGYEGIWNMVVWLHTPNLIRYSSDNTEYCTVQLRNPHRSHNVVKMQP